MGVSALDKLKEVRKRTDIPEDHRKKIDAMIEKLSKPDPKGIEFDLDDNRSFLARTEVGLVLKLNSEQF